MTRTAAALFVLVACAAFGADYFVAPDGDDANPGTLEKPVKDPVKAAAKLMPGDTVYFRAGTYKCRTSGTVGLAPSRDGEDGKPITFKNHNDERVQFDFTGSDWGLTNNGYAYIVFDGFDITNKTHYGMKLSAASGRRTPDGGNVYGHHVTIRNCEVHHTDSECIFAAMTPNLTIENCHLHHSGRSHGLYLQVGCHNAAVRNVTSEHNYGNSGMQLNAAGGGIKDALVERCILRYNAHGFSLMGAQKCTFRNNILYNNGYDGPRGSGNREIILWTYGTADKPGTPCEGCLFENNTVVNVVPKGHKLGQLVQMQAGTKDIVFRNNVFYVVGKPIFTISDDARTGHTFENNCLFTSGNAAEVTGAKTLGATAKAAGFTEKGTLSGDPGLADATNGDLRLRANSRCVDAGAPTKAEFKFVGKAPDIGALERGAELDIGCKLPWKKQP